jgi:flagellin-like protein
VTPIIAVVLLVAMTVVLAGILYTILRVPIPPQAPYVGFSQEWNDTSVELIGQGDNQPGGGQCPAATNHICFMPGLTIVVSQLSQQAILISQVEVIFQCHGQGAMVAPLSSINYTNTLKASTGPTPSPTSGGGLCGGSVAPNYCAFPNGTAYPSGVPQPNKGCPGGAPPTGGNWLNCFGSVGPGVPLYDLIYYTPDQSSDRTLQAGDTFTAYFGGYCISSLQDGSVGDDYYGPPAYCESPAGGCGIELLYTGIPNTVLGSFSLAVDASA